MTPHTPYIPERAFERGAEAFAQTPPPYRLCCDLAMLTLLVETRALCEWAGIPVLPARRSPLAVLLARYHRGRFGPNDTPLEPSPGRGHVYDEVAFSFPLDGLRGNRGCFPELWLDTPEPTPIDLGWHYGFPKYPAAIHWRQRGRDLSVSARPHVPEHVSLNEQSLSVRGRLIGRVPTAPLIARIAGRAEFSRTGMRASMRIESAERARVLFVRAVEMANSPISGHFKTVPVGIWLERAWLFLGPPEGERP